MYASVCIDRDREKWDSKSGNVNIGNPDKENGGL